MEGSTLQTMVDRGSGAVHLHRLYAENISHTLRNEERQDGMSPELLSDKSAQFTEKIGLPQYSGSAHAKAVKEPEFPFVDYDLSDAVEHSLVLVRHVLHKSRRSEHHDVRHISERLSYLPTGLTLRTEEPRYVS